MVSGSGGELSLTVVVDKDRCLGSGNCMFTAPDVFDQSEDDGTVILLATHPEGALSEAVNQAARSCPGKAIKVVEG